VRRQEKELKNRGLTGENWKNLVYWKYEEMKKMICNHHRKMTDKKKH
jgi:hypothetical protein